jgi:hypothetical protein
VLRPGTPVPGTVVRSRLRLADGRYVGLGGCNEGELSGACYPVISQHDEHAWVIDGPQFSNGTADGPVYTDRLTLAPDGTLAAWGHGGNVVKLTTDYGQHWHAALWSGGIYMVAAKGPRLVVRALGSQIPPGDEDAPFATRQYVSTNDGQTWRRARSRPPVPY